MEININLLADELQKLQLIENLHESTMSGKIIPLMEIKQVKGGFLVVDKETNEQVSKMVSTLGEAYKVKRIVSILSDGGELSFPGSKIDESLKDPFVAFKSGSKYFVHDRNYKKVGKSFDYYSDADGYAFQLIQPIGQKIFRRFQLDCISYKTDINDLEVLKNYIIKNYPEYEGGEDLLLTIKNFIRKYQEQVKWDQEHKTDESKKDVKWMQKAFKNNKGGLHKALNVPKGDKIPKDKLDKAVNSKDKHVKKMAQLVKNVEK